MLGSVSVFDLLSVFKQMLWGRSDARWCEKRAHRARQDGRVVNTRSPEFTRASFFQTVSGARRGWSSRAFWRSWS